MKRIAIVALVVAAALPASASIALFTDGRSMKIRGFKLIDANAIELLFKNGGVMTMPLNRIERILDDEIDHIEKAPEVALPKRSWAYDARRGPIFRSSYDQLIIEAARKFDVDAALISAVIKAESDFNPGEISNKGARGLMQLMPATAERFGVANSFDAKANINGGARYLRWLLDTFEGNANLALAGYNAGEQSVWKYNGVPPFRETITYINRVARTLLSVRAHQTAAASASSGAGTSAERN
jgi:membrane-bound lytic murein transglycosylase B